MALVASGLMNKQVANELSISEVTVKMHRSSAMRKLGAKSVARLARIADVLDSQRLAGPAIARKSVGRD
jgi:DNA-binding NarL/FixJ family response regulator